MSLHVKINLRHAQFILVSAGWNFDSSLVNNNDQKQREAVILKTQKI